MVRELFSRVALKGGRGIELAQGLSIRFPSEVALRGHRGENEVVRGVPRGVPERMVDTSY
jgi:hypothetical protein